MTVTAHLESEQLMPFGLVAVETDPWLAAVTSSQSDLWFITHADNERVSDAGPDDTFLISEKS